MSEIIRGHRALRAWDAVESTYRGLGSYGVEPTAPMQRAYLQALLAQGKFDLVRIWICFAWWRACPGAHFVVLCRTSLFMIILLIFTKAFHRFPSLCAESRNDSLNNPPSWRPF